MKELKCPHCGLLFRRRECKPLTPKHLLLPLSKDIFTVCPGSMQNPRNALSDKRPLWSEGGVA